ncbi:MAG: type II toxin-antitoxin system HipA family toxin [Spartobacteria bacterium]|nr:type II toxin-antitoxin system HipA family toxin [Spartobacteria bacterium]
MKGICHSSLKPGAREGYTSAARKRLAGGHRKFPFRLDFTRPDVIAFRTDHVEHMSISGVQDKISLRLERGGKLRPTEKDGEYILKPVPSTPLPSFLADVPANEHVTMQIADQLFGIVTPPNACVLLLDGEPAYLVKRFDRNQEGDKIAQEDFCQLSGRSPDTGRNYKYDGSYEEMASLLRKYCAAYKTEVEKLFRLICFNYVFSNGDAHFKNFSLVQTEQGDYILSPAYDLLCTSLHLPNEPRLALDLFDDYESAFFSANGFYGAPDFLELARRFDIPGPRAENIMRSFGARKKEVGAIVERSFLSNGARELYHIRFADRLRAMAAF